ncbi:MAG: CerR family C-terminal domain-containing protein [Deltaproteobacteria bacterium]|nr:CerR family C-terminal domain-containing protein [Deltaproteobacteria bacterium]MBW1923584.1 CerR family C-terminal domain-containing protein [Deltaproteobacteria bacterium]MBW1948576.1 CerR family C-terminal domain-containing protein [Deltaproteobacteria bacterium]MBW2006748.1 CerR family C-terminal domain-containing protein [Deltaproteobacteria bacterium]
MAARETDPKERLLDEAEALFAENGYHAVSVREITAAAGCNLAAINYHFGNKRNLYLEVFRTRWLARARVIQERVYETLQNKKEITPPALIRALAEAFLFGPMSEKDRLRHVQLMQREVIQPTEAFEMVMDEVMKPFLGALGERIRPYLPAGTDQERLMLNALSIISLILYFNFGRESVKRITGRAYDQAFREELIRHIVRFTTTGLGLGAGENAS